MPKKCWMLHNFDRIRVYPLSGIYGLVLIVFLRWTYFFWKFCPGLLLTVQNRERGKILFFPTVQDKEKQRVSNIFNENGVLFTWKPFQTYTIYHLCTYKRQVVPQNRVSIISFVGSFCIYESVIYKWKDVCLERLSDSWPRLKSCETGLICNLLGNQLNRFSFR